MGYSTYFTNSFTLSERPDHNPDIHLSLDETLEKINLISTSRRMMRDLNLISDENNNILGQPVSFYGIEGEFFTNHSSDFDDSIIDHNQPPSTQPGLWMHWNAIKSNGDFLLRWNGSEKFYFFVEWIEYLIAKVFHPNGISIDGEVLFEGDDEDDKGCIHCAGALVYLEKY